MPMTNCPDVAMLNSLLAGGLSGEQEQQMSDHLDRCVECRDRLERAAAGDRTLRDVARNLRGSRELTDSVKRVIQKCSSDPSILLGGGIVDPSGDSAVLTDQLLDTGLQPTRANRQHTLPTTPAFTVKPGSRLGSYVILEEIGRGGMGVVWKARDPERNRLVAIKVLEIQVLADETARKRFLREARAVASVSHRNVVTMYGVEESPVPYLVMEFVDGPSLRTHLARKGPLDLMTVLRIALQIANGLEASHARGVTHRDIKPANIVLDIPTGRAKLTDFGLAQIEGDVKLTHVGFIAGTPAYMSPEQAMGESVDHRSDLFSLGTVIYAMATGRSPFDDDRTQMALDRVCAATPDSPQAINPSIPSSLSDLIQWLHAKDPANRPGSAAEVSQILRRQLEQLKQSEEKAKSSPASSGSGVMSRSSDKTRSVRVSSGEISTQPLPETATTTRKPAWRQGLIVLGLTTGGVLAFALRNLLGAWGVW